MDTRTNITRRSILQALPVIAAGAAIPTVAHAVRFGDSESVSMAQLIETHRTALAAFNAAVDARILIEHEIARHPRALVPLAVNAQGECKSGYGELGTLTADGIREMIVETHVSLRKRHCSGWVLDTMPEMRERIAAELDASGVRALASLERELERVAERKRVAGLEDASAAEDAASEAEEDARLKLFVARPINAEEAEAKAAYLAEPEAAETFSDWCADEVFIADLLALLGRVS